MEWMSWESFSTVTQRTPIGTVLSSQLKIPEKVPDQNATALQVTSAVIAGMAWALKNPERGYV